MDEGLGYSYVEDEREDDRYKEMQPTLEQFQAILRQLEEEGLTPEEIDEWIKLQEQE